MYELEYNDTMDFATEMLIDIPMRFSLSTSSDVEWFKVYLEANKIITYQFTVPDSETNGLWRIIIYNANMVQGNVNNWSSSSSSTYSSPTAGHYYFKVSIHPDLPLLYSGPMVELKISTTDW